MENTQDFVLNTEIIERELAILQEEVPGFAVPVLQALAENNINMNTWHRCIMGHIAKDEAIAGAYHEDPEWLSRSIHDDYQKAHGKYPDYVDSHGNRTNDYMTYTEIVGFEHDTELFDYLETALQKYLPQPEITE